MLPPNQRACGCRHCDGETGTCLLMFSDAIQPTLATQMQISPPGAIEGPPTTINGWKCEAASSPELQTGCSSFSSEE